MNNSLVPELYCSNIISSKQFYIKVLGFKVVYETPEDRFCYIEREGTELMIEQPDDPWLAAPLEHPYGRGISLRIEVKDIKKLYEIIQESGVSIFLEMEEKWYRKAMMQTGNRQFIVQDPDGYLLRFFQDLGEKPI